MTANYRVRSDVQVISGHRLSGLSLSFHKQAYAEEQISATTDVDLWSICVHVCLAHDNTRPVGSLLQRCNNHKTFDFSVWSRSAVLTMITVFLYQYATVYVLTVHMPVFSNHTSCI